MSLPSFDPTGVARINPAQIENILACGMTPPHLKAIARAMRDYGIGLFFLPQTSEPLSDTDFAEAKAFIAIVGDDRACAMGPEAFDDATLQRLIKNSVGVSIMSCDFNASIYGHLSHMAGMQLTGATVIETRPEMEDVWLAYIRSVSKTVPIILCTPDPDRLGKDGTRWGCA